VHEKLTWIYNLYDVKQIGRIGRDEMLSVLESVYELIGVVHSVADTNAPTIQHVNDVFSVVSLCPHI
jgi:hypothetical protein